LFRQISLARRTLELRPLKEFGVATNEIISLGINALLVLITGVYAIFTFKILKANQRVADEMALQRRDILRPIISIGPEFDEYLVASLVIENSGQSPATNVVLTLDKDFYPFAEVNEANNLKSYSIFSRPISTLASRATLRFDLAQGFNLDKSHNGKTLTPLEFKITAQYEYLDQKFNDEFHLDLKPFMRSTRRRSMQVDELEKIRKAIEKMANK
jgi:hypothetical protein